MCRAYEHPHGTPIHQNNKLPPEHTKPKHKQMIQTRPAMAHGSDPTYPHSYIDSVILIRLYWLGYIGLSLIARFIRHLTMSKCFKKKLQIRESYFASSTGLSSQRKRVCTRKTQRFRIILMTKHMPIAKWLEGAEDSYSRILKEVISCRLCDGYDLDLHCFVRRFG